MLKNVTLRNFCFGGQSAEHPMANRIAAGVLLPEDLCRLLCT